MAETTSYPLPDGYEDEAAFIEEARQRFQQGASYDQKNREEAREDLRFFSGEQWHAQDVSAREGRPCLTINRLPQFVAQVVGDIRINQPAIKARPAQNADKDLAEIREGLIRAIEHQSGAQRVYADTAQAQIACGIANFRCVIDYLADDAFDRDIFIRPIPNPLAVVWDPMITDATGKDAGWCFVEDLMPRKVYEAKYGNEIPAGLGDTLMTEGWFLADVVRVTEYWLVKERPAEIALLTDGRIEELTATNRAQLAPLIARNRQNQPMVRKTVRKSVCMYLISGTKILEKPVEYQISRIPVFRVPGWEVNLGNDAPKVRFGLVRFARDPQRLQNYWRSVSAEVLALAPRQQWLVHESQQGEADDFRAAATSGDTVLTWSGSVPPQRLEPPPIPAAILQEAALNAQDMKDVTGLHDASLGVRSNETSGKAIMARQREGDVATYLYQDNLKSAIAECGRVVNELIPAVYDTTREVRILGADETQKVMTVNDPADPESVDLAKGKYDIVVETGPSYSTKRVEAAESMMQFVQAVPMAAQAAADLIAKAQDWPMADEIGERLQKLLPPNLTQPDPESMSPEDQAAYQQQMMAAKEQAAVVQQMQQQGAQLSLAEQEAKVLKLRAEAQHRMAEANRLGMPEAADPQMQQYEYALKDAQLRLANANADEAQANAGIAYFNLAQLTNPANAEAEALKAQAEAASAAASAHQATIQTAADLHDLAAKPLATAHQAVDLQNKLNPPDAEGSADQGEPGEGQEAE